MNYNIFQIANEIFNREPQQPKSIQLILNLNEYDCSIIFEILVLFLLEGILIKYDNDELNELFLMNEENLYNKIYYKFRQYFNSIGFNIKLNITKIKPLNYKKELSFYKEKTYPLEISTLLLINNDNNQEIYIEYFPEVQLKSELLENYYVILKTDKYSLEINFSFL